MDDSKELAEQVAAKIKRGHPSDIIDHIEAYGRTVRDAERVRAQMRLNDLASDLNSRWVHRRAHDSDLTFAARIGCAEDLREAIEAEP